MAGASSQAAADLAVALRAYLETDGSTPFPRPPATQAAWTRDIGKLYRIPPEEALTLYTDIAKQDTPDFRKNLAPIVDRMLARLRTFEANVLSRDQNQQARWHLMRPRSLFKFRWTRSASAVLRGELENFRLADPAAPAGSHEANDGGTHWIHRLIWVVIIMTPDLLPGAVALHNNDRLLMAILGANLCRAATITIGKAREPLSNFGVMLESFADWVVPTFVGPPMFQIGPTFDPSPDAQKLRHNKPYQATTTTASFLLLLAPNYGPTWIRKLSDFLSKTEAPTITDEQGYAATIELLEGLRIDKAEANKIYNAYIQGNRGCTGNRSKISSSASQAMFQWNEAIDVHTAALSKAAGIAEQDSADPPAKIKGEQWAQWGLCAFTALILGVKIGTSVPEDLLLQTTIIYSAFALLKIWDNTGGATILSIRVPGNKNKRFADTQASFSNLAAPSVPQLIVAIANLVLMTRTGKEALDNTAAFSVCLVGLAAIILVAGSHIGPVSTFLGIKLVERLSGGRLDLLPKEPPDNTPAELRPTTRLNQTTANELATFVSEHLLYSLIPPEPIPDDPAHPTPDELGALREWEQQSHAELYRQTAQYLLPMLAEGEEPLAFDAHAFIDHLLAYAMPMLVRHRNIAARQAADPQAEAVQPAIAPAGETGFEMPILPRHRNVAPQQAESLRETTLPSAVHSVSSAVDVATSTVQSVSAPASNSSAVPSRVESVSSRSDSTRPILYLRRGWVIWGQEGVPDDGSVQYDSDHSDDHRL